MSEAEFLPVGEVASFREVLPRTIHMPLPPRFTFGTVPADVMAQYYQAMLLSAIGVYAGTGFEIADGFMLRRDGRVVISGELKLFKQTMTQHLAADAAREAGYDARPRRRIPGAAALITSPGYTIYGHWLADILPRLAVLRANGWDLDDLTYPVPHNTPKFGLEMLRLIGVPAARIVVGGKDEVLRPDELLMPTLIHNGTRYAPLLADMVDMFRSGLQRAGHSLHAPRAPRRIYLARTLDNRLLVNREIIQGLAEKAGFTVVRPETMSLPDQYALFASVREIAGEYGSAFHNALFSPEGTIVCGLRGSQHHPGFLQSAMGEVLGHATGYVFGQSGTGPGPHDYTVPEQAFSDCLRLAFGPHAHFELQRRAPAEVPAPKPAPVPEPLRGYRKPPHQPPPPPKPPFWQFWHRHQEPAAAPRPTPGSLYPTLMGQDGDTG